MRATVPPFFIFKWYPTPASSRSVQFKGLAVPGFSGLPATADLVAVWKTTDGQRFQNYRATFTLLNAPVIARAWLKELAAGSGTNPIGSPLFGIEEKYVRTRDDEQALLEHANWNRSEKGIRVFRLRPERAMLLFGTGMTTVSQAFSESKISQTNKYQLLGNTVAPSVARHCGEAAKLLCARADCIASQLPSVCWTQLI